MEKRIIVGKFMGIYRIIIHKWWILGVQLRSLTGMIKTKLSIVDI